MKTLGDKMEQRTDEWYRARCGQLGASQINKVLAKTKTGAESATRKNLIAELVCMRLTGQSPEGFTSAAMQWGIDNEPNARTAYEFIKNVDVIQTGWIPHKTIEWTGCSPDGLVGDNGLIEIKCGNTATHIEWMLAGVPPKEHQNQMLWQMEVCDKQWCDFVSYDPRLPIDLQLFIVRLDRDEEKIKLIREEVIKFLQEVDEMIDNLENRK